MKKKVSVLFIILAVMFIISGCYETETTFNINEEGKTDIEMIIKADETMAGDEVKSTVWGLENSLPELQNNYNLEKEHVQENYSDYIVYTFKNKNSFDIAEMKNIKFTEKNNHYNFSLNIPSLVNDINEDNEDDVMFIIKINMPKEIDMANSSSVDGKQVTWKVTREQLVDGLTLKANTK